jgi:TonB family protein
VASDTRSLVLSKPNKVETEVKPLPAKDAFSINETHKKKPDIRPKNVQKYAPLPPDNQVFASTRQAASNPMYTPPAGSNGVGISENSVLGTKFGAYADLLRQRITAAWQRHGLDPRGQRDPAVVSLIIMQNGSVQNIQLVQTSGNPAIDNSVLRALYQANPLPPLPPGLGSSFPIQFTFNLK